MLYTWHERAVTLRLAALTVRERAEPTQERQQRPMAQRMKAVTLAQALTARLEQLGISRRELATRTGLGRSTIHNIEGGGRTALRPDTLAKLDEALYWKRGTAVALSNGDDSILADADLLIREDDGSTTRWALVMRVSRLSLAELQQLTAYLDQRAQSA